MKFSLMTYTMHPVMNSGKMSLLDVMRFAKGLGFDALEFTMTDFDRDSRQNIKLTLAMLGLKVSCINGTYRLAAGDETLFQEAVTGAKRMVDTAVDYACDRVMVVPAMREDIGGMADRKRAAGRIMAGLKQVVDYGNSRQVIVTVEDFPDQVYPLATMDELQAMLDEVPGLKLTLDNGNFVPGGDDLMDAYQRLKQHIANVHIKDWEPAPQAQGILCRDGKYIRGGSHGKGLIDQAPLLKALIADGYDQYLAFEYEGVLDHADETRNGFAYLTKSGEIAYAIKNGDLGKFIPLLELTGERRGRGTFAVLKVSLYLP